jgi:hypothetical protein
MSHTCAAGDTTSSSQRNGVSVSSARDAFLTDQKRHGARGIDRPPSRLECLQSCPSASVVPKRYSASAPLTLQFNIADRVAIQGNRPHIDKSVAALGRGNVRNRETYVTAKPLRRHRMYRPSASVNLVSSRKVGPPHRTHDPPSITVSFGSFASPFTTLEHRLVKSLSFRERKWSLPLVLNAMARYPSILSSYCHRSRSSGRASVRRDSIGSINFALSVFAISVESMRSYVPH